MCTYNASVSARLHKRDSSVRVRVRAKSGSATCEATEKLSVSACASFACVRMHSRKEREFGDRERERYNMHINTYTYACTCVRGLGFVQLSRPRARTLALRQDYVDARQRRECSFPRNTRSLNYASGCALISCVCVCMCLFVRETIPIHARTNNAKFPPRVCARPTLSD